MGYKITIKGHNFKQELDVIDTKYLYNILEKSEFLTEEEIKLRDKISDNLLNSYNEHLDNHQ